MMAPNIGTLVVYITYNSTSWVDQSTVNPLTVRVTRPIKRVRRVTKLPWLSRFGITNTQAALHANRPSVEGRKAVY
jgi:tryptophan synthase alpha subunit